MAKYIVKLHERYVEEVLVEASSEKEALEKVKDGEGDSIPGSLNFVEVIDFDPDVKEHIEYPF